MFKRKKSEPRIEMPDPDKNAVKKVAYIFIKKLGKLRESFI